MPLIRAQAELTVHDVDTDDAWRKRYGERVPVLELDGVFVCQYRLDKPAVLAALADCPG